MTEICFRKCITNKISAGALDRSEESCMANCVGRMMDAQKVLLNRVEGMQRG
jgi:import inner membrane translocase subunit TIM8